MDGKTFLELLEESLPPKTHPRYHVWKDHELNATKRSQRVLKYVERYTNVDEKRILDLGCGTGGTLVAFAKAGGCCVGIDTDNTCSLHIKMAKVRCAEEKVDTEIILGDGCKTPFRDGVFNVIICDAIIEHVLYPMELAKEISRILNKNGILYLTAPNRFSPLQIYHDEHYGLFGVVLLPRALAKIYVTKIRKREEKYTVGYIPTYGYLEKIFKKAGIKLDIIAKERFNMAFENHSAIKNETCRKIVMLVDKLRLGGLIKRLVTSSLFMPSFIFIGKKVRD